MISTSLLLLLLAAVHCVHSVELIQSASSVSMPGQSLTLTCKVSGYSLTDSDYCTHWIRQPAGKTLEWIGRICSRGGTDYSEKLKSRFQISRVISSSTVTLTGQNMQTEDTAVYYCARERRVVDYWGKGTQVTVTSATQQAPRSLFSAAQCGESNGYVTLGCITRDLSSAVGLSFTWKDASGRALTDTVQYPAVSGSGGYSSVSQARVSASDWNASKKFTCEVTNAKGTKTAHLQKPAVIVTAPKISISTSIDSTSNKINLNCWLDGFRPKAINVDWGEVKQATEKKFKNEETNDFSMLSQISVNPQQWNEGKEFTCRATHRGQTFRQAWSICKEHPSSQPRISLEKPSLRSILTDNQVTASCVVETVFQTKISWLVDGNKKSGIDSKRLDGTTVSNLRIPVEDWTKSQTLTCKAEHPCFKTKEERITITENVQKTPTVLIRRSLADIGKRDSAVLECVVSSLSSGELSVTFQANDENFPTAQYVNLPEGQDTLTARFTIPQTHRRKNTRFTCQIQRNRSIKWRSNSIGNLFDDPSVELSVVSSDDKSASTTQKLLCSGTGLNPEIKWLPESVGNATTIVAMNADGRVKVSSELSVPEQEWKRVATFTCQVSDQGRSKTVQKETSFCAVTPDQARNTQFYLLGPSISDMPEKNPVSVTCLLLGHRLQDFSINCKVGTTQLSSNVNKTETYSNGTESVQRVIKVPAERWNKHENVSCEVKHPCSNAQTYVTSKSKDLAATLYLTTPTQTELDNGTATFICLASNFLPKSHTFKWTYDKMDLRKKVKPTILSKDEDTYTATSILQLSADEWTGSSSSVKCEFLHTVQKLYQEASYGSCETNQPKVTIIPPSNKDILINRSGSLLCKAEGPTGFNGIKWYANNEEIASLPKDVSAKTIALSTPITYEDWSNGAKFTCEVHHSSFVQGFVQEDYQRGGDGNLKCPEVYLLAPPESSESDSVTLTCYVKDFYPKEVAVSWLVDDKQVDNLVGFRQSTTTVIEKDSKFSVYSQLIVKTADWKNGSLFTCSVYHESIKDPVRHKSRSVTYDSKSHTLVSLNLTIPQSCPPTGLY